MTIRLPCCMRWIRCTAVESRVGRPETVPQIGGPSTYQSPKDRITKATKIPLGHTGSFFFSF